MERDAHGYHYISREALEDVQRAFVSFQHFEYRRIQDADNSKLHNWSIVADFENSGVTNAANVVGITEVKELPTEPNEKEFAGPYTHLRIIGMPPKSVRGIRIVNPVPEPLIFGIDLGPAVTAQSGQKTHFNRQLYVWGWVYYRDVFKIPHITEFCNHLTGIEYITQNLSTTMQAQPGLEFTYESCRAHNCDDGQCDDYQTIVEIAEKRN